MISKFKLANNGDESAIKSITRDLIFNPNCFKANIKELMEMSKNQNIWASIIYVYCTIKDDYARFLYYNEIYTNNKIAIAGYLAGNIFEDSQPDLAFKYYNKLAKNGNLIGFYGIGNIYFKKQNWLCAINAYEKYIYYDTYGIKKLLEVAHIAGDFADIINNIIDNIVRCNIAEQCYKAEYYDKYVEIHIDLEKKDINKYNHQKKVLLAIRDHFRNNIKLKNIQKYLQLVRQYEAITEFPEIKDMIPLEIGELLNKCKNFDSNSIIIKDLFAKYGNMTKSIFKISQILNGRFRDADDANDYLKNYYPFFHPIRQYHFELWKLLGVYPKLHNLPPNIVISKRKNIAKYLDENPNEKKYWSEPPAKRRKTSI